MSISFKMKSAIIIFVLVLGLAFAAELPKEWQKCTESNDLGKCLTSAVQDVLPRLKNGVPEFNMPPIDPVAIPTVTIGEGTGTVHVVQNYKDFKINGISTIKVEKITPTKDSDGTVTLDVDAFLPDASFIADYNFNGRILVLPIIGDGKCQVGLKDVVIQVKLVCKTIEKKGVKHYDTPDVTVHFTPGKVTYNFENLFNGDKRLGDEMNKVLNDNWKEVYLDVKSGYEKVLEAIFADFSHKIFSKVPAKDLF